MVVTTCRSNQMINTLMLIVDDVVHEEIVNSKEVETRDKSAKIIVGENLDSPIKSKPISRPLTPLLET